MSVRPADFPPPVSEREFIAAPTDPPDERIDVGLLIVGGGPAGLVAGIRAGQLLQERPDLAERLGDVPVAVVEKGKSCGSHVLSGAVVNPRALRLLFPGMRADDMPFSGPVDHESVYYLTSKRAVQIPPPPTMLNHGNYLGSMSRISRWLAERAEELGVTIVPETSASKLLVSGGRVVGVRTGDRGRGKNGQELGNFEPGSDISARATILAEGTIGHLTRAAIAEFRVQGEAPQIYALGVKEVWEVPKPLHKVIHTMGWPLRGGARYREFGGSFIYPMGDDMVCIGLVVGLDYTDASLSVHDMLQELKLHPLVRKIIEGGTRVAWGAKTIPEGGIQAMPARFSVPGALFVGDAAGFVNVPALKGVHYAMRSGMLAAEAAIGAIGPGGTAWEPGGLEDYDHEIRESFIWRDLERVRNMRPAFHKGFVRGSIGAGIATASLGKMPRKNSKVTADADAAVSDQAAGKTYPKPDGILTFDKLSSVFLSGNKTRDDAPDHLRVRHQVPRELAETWVNMCPAQVYEIVGNGSADDEVTVEVTASNCVQCGAITAKGGRLTPPEGGDGPDYTLM